MEELLELLQDLDPDVDFETEDNLIDGKILNSFTIINMIAEICDTFDIEIGPKYMVNENFNSAQAMWEMICRIREEEE